VILLPARYVSSAIAAHQRPSLAVFQITLGQFFAAVAFLVCFLEHSAFTRAFKRWSGMAPTSYRAERLAVH
jgi:methylphosphotriester-DNA--protein-cysteine methyltransferase